MDRVESLAQQLGTVQMDSLVGKVMSVDIARASAPQLAPNELRTAAERHYDAHILEMLNAHARADQWYHQHRESGLTASLQETFARNPLWKRLIPWAQDHEYNRQLDEMAPTLGSYPELRDRHPLDPRDNYFISAVLGGIAEIPMMLLHAPVVYQITFTSFCVLSAMEIRRITGEGSVSYGKPLLLRNAEYLDRIHLEGSAPGVKLIPKAANA